ncbi:MAG: translocation/assembly module TamB domain-containing protein [Pseudomonadota bacterium]
MKISAKPLAKGAVRVVVGLALLTALVGVGALVFVDSDYGTRRIMQEASTRLRASSGINVEWQTLEGGLLTGLRLQNVRVTTDVGVDDFAVAVRELQVEVNPLLLIGNILQFDQLAATGVTYTAASNAAEPPEPFTAAKLQDALFTLPISLSLPTATIRDVQLQLGESPVVFDALDASLALDNEELEVSGLQWRQGPTIVSGSVALSQSLALQGDVTWRTAVDASAYAGTVMLGGTLQELSVQHRLLQPVVVSSNGTIKPSLFDDEPESVQLTHVFSQLALLDLGVEGDYVVSGEVSTTGTATALDLAGRLNTTLAGYDPLQLDFAVAWQPERLEIASVRLSSTQLDVQGTGSLDIQNEDLQLQWELARLSPGTALPSMQLLDVVGNGAVQARRNNGVIETAVTLTDLQGLLNGYPLAVTGNLAVVDATVTTVALRVVEEDNVLSASGSINPALDLQWEVQVPQLQALWSPLAGRLNGKGNLRGSPAAPEIDGNLAGSELAYDLGERTLRVASLQIAAESAEQENDLTFVANNIALTNAAGAAPTMLLDAATVHVTGTLQQHGIEADLRAADTAATFSLQGSAENPDWQGSLSDAVVTSRYGNWTLEQETALGWISAALQADESCWRNEPVRLCANVGYDATNGVDASLQATGVPLDWLNGMSSADAPLKPSGVQEWQDSRSFRLPENVQASGTLSLDATVDNYASGNWQALAFNLTADDARMQISIPLDPQDEDATPVQQSVRFDDVSVHVENSAAVWDSTLSFSVVEEDADNLQPGNFEAALQVDADGNLDGHTMFAFSQLDWLELLQPQVRNLQGQVTGDVAVSGTRETPEFMARVDLQDGSFNIPRAGLQLTAANLSLVSTGDNDLELQGSAHSGEGELLLTSSLQDVMTDTFTVTASLSGENFQLLNIVDTTATISPDLTLDYRDKRIRIDGSVTVPHMALNFADAVKGAGTEAIKVSRDAVIVKDENGDPLEPTSNVLDVPVLADIALTLGEDVRVRGYGLDAEIVGTVDIEQGADRPALVYGTLNIPKGTYEIYRQQLQITDGRLLFFGAPFNPQVDIRAVRSTRELQAGMHLTGMVSNIQGELFSSPTMPESEILAVLVTGKSFGALSSGEGTLLLSAFTDYGFEKGQGLTNMVSSTLGLDSVSVERGDTLEESALGVGKYLRPGLMLRYKIGVFDRQSVLSIDYKLTERLKLIVETGLSQSIDISYTKEVD